MGNKNIAIAEGLLNDDNRMSTFREIHYMYKLRKREGFVKFLTCTFDDDFEDFKIGMELYDGDLSKIIEKNEYGLKRRIAIAIKIVKSVQFLHSKKVLHRDLKVQNILYKERAIEKEEFIETEGEEDEDGDFKREDVVDITDFGLSKECSVSKGSVLGTLHYIDPNILVGKGEKYGEEFDVYALGFAMAHLFAKKNDYRKIISKEFLPLISFVFKNLVGLDGSHVEVFIKDLVDNNHSVIKDLNSGSERIDKLVKECVVLYRPRRVKVDRILKELEMALNELNE